MTVPIDAVKVFHNAFRQDMAGIDAVALGAARGEPGSRRHWSDSASATRCLWCTLSGEEIAVFPALEEVAPLVAEAYEKDHRGLDAAFDALNDAVSAGDALATARATAAFKFYLDIHLFKKDTHLYRIFAERVPVPDRGKAVGIMAAQMPPERQPEFIAWPFPLIGDGDRENMLRIQRMVLPPRRSRESRSSYGEQSATTGRS
ncbi:MAG TPA: hypothetical protein VFH61_04025 [Thermoleophilia bacterium]|nr:hypothetical protein [Thermoleophilia bacterium]